MYQQMKHDIFKKAVGVFALLSLFLVISTVYVAWEEISFYENGNELVGRVVGFDTEYKSGRKLEFPVISFSDGKGRVRSLRSNLATIYGGIHKLGDSYSVIYNSEKPNKLRENSMIGLFGKLLLVGAMTYLNFILLLIFQYYLVITPAESNIRVLLRTGEPLKDAAS